MKRPLAIGLVACGKAKACEARPARELYTGSLFRAALADALATSDRVFIVSAKHGLVELDAIVEPYDTKLRAVAAFAWARNIADELARLVPGRRQITIHAGETYARALAIALVRDVFESCAGLTLGERLSFYRQRRDARARVAAFTAAGGIGLAPCRAQLGLPFAALGAK